MAVRLPATCASRELPSITRSTLASRCVSVSPPEPACRGGAADTLSATSSMLANPRRSHGDAEYSQGRGAQALGSTTEEDVDPVIGALEGVVWEGTGRAVVVNTIAAGGTAGQSVQRPIVGTRRREVVSRDGVPTHRGVIRDNIGGIG